MEVMDRPSGRCLRAALGIAVVAIAPAVAQELRVEEVREARRRALEATVPLPSAETLASLPLVDFTQHVKPLLSDRCFACHGFDEGSRQAGLRLDVRESALRRDRTGGAAIVPGDLEASRLAWRVFHPDAGVRMPPAGSGKELSEDERRVLARWIADGAPYDEHWSYRALDAPALAEGESAVDVFVARGLEGSGLDSAPTASPEVLARRLALDVVGLPPTADAIAPLTRRFLADPSDASYRRLVDDLLSSPHYGERLAVHWLDLVRYADTNGYHSDEPRSVSPYRDWVIAAFNDNLPFDRFTVEQLAGDLLPNPSTEQLVASTFNRLNQLTAEGGAQEMEYRAKYDADRVRAVSTIWMGATLGCAECHDHKFDPYRQRDFYSMAAFFADIEEHDVYTTGESWDPLMPLPTTEQRRETAELDRRIARVEAEIAASDEVLAEARASWLRSLRETVRRAGGGWPGWQVVTPLAWQTEGSELVVLDDLSLLATGPKPPGDVYTVELETRRSTPVTALRLEVLGHPSLKGGLARAGRGSGELGEIELEVRESDGGWRALVFSAARDERDYHGRRADVAIDGTTSSRWGVRQRRPIDDRIRAAFTLTEPLDAEPGTRLRVRLHHHGLNNRVAFGRFRFALTSDAEPQLWGADPDEPEGAAPAPVTNDVAADVLALAAEAESSAALAASERVVSFYRRVAPELAEQRARWVDLHGRRLEIELATMTTLATVARSEPRQTHVLERGNWQTPGEVVTPSVPAFLPPLVARGERPDRLDLARWLVAEDNPLTSRVVVNRFFELFFGRGLSPVLDDLGSQGGAPSHAELLDALAGGFVASGWDTKGLVRTLVTSRTYRRSSQATPAMKERDPYNRLLARQSRLRLDAEFVRDNALAIAGLLSTDVGGPSVRPYQPEGYWRNANTFGGSSLDYHPSAGADQYRRGLYSYWKRSFLHPSMLAFDAPSREECIAEREVSNTPLQALALLNDPTYVEAARVLAEKVLREGGSSDDERVAWLFDRALLRPIAPGEAEILSALLQAHRAEYEASATEAERLVSTGQVQRDASLPVAELAAWTSVTRAVLNLPEIITRF
jgi:hypothetical protein